MTEVVEIAGKGLFVKGNLDPEIRQKCAAVIGSRRMTDYGRMAVEKLVPDLVQQGYTIVSGFMYGIDITAHQTAIDCGGKTVAVLGWGIEYPMISKQRQLANKIIETGGLLISEWKKQEPTLWTFPMRNKIVVALSQRIYVIEAANNSGTLMTAEYGYKLKKEIWAVPGPVTSSVSMGTNKLIADGKAKVWLPK